MTTKPFVPSENKPAILLIDIETAPDVVWTWGVYQENAIAVKEHWYVLSFAAKWLGARSITTKGLDDYKGYTSGSSTEKHLLKEIHSLLDRADIVVAHNGADFDVRKLNARFIAVGLPPPSPYKVVDTKRDLVRVARFSSNRLNWLSKQLGIGRKTMEHHDWKMWEGCMNGDAKCWRAMKVYNRHDVVLLEELYRMLAPWIEQPNANVWSAKPTCPNPTCSKPNLVGHGVYRSKTRTYQRFRCTTCGSMARSTRSSSATTITPTAKKYS